MNENEQPVKKKRGRPPGHHDGRPKGSGKPRTNMELDVVPGGHNVTASEDRKKAVSIIAPETEGVEVPTLIAGCVQIRQTVDLDNPATLWNAMQQYLTLCANTGMKISNSFMYLACGVSRQIISEWYLGNKRQNNPEYRKFASMVKEICAAAREQYGIEGKTNPILTIFHQKFYDGFVDNPGSEQYADPLGEIQDPQKLAEKYKDLITD